MYLRTKLVIALALLLSLQTSAQQSELDPVTVTASIRPVPASATGRNIVVIKGEQFSKLPVNSIDELLRYLPGLEVQARGPMGSQSDIILRGGTFQQVLVIIDGIRINNPNTGHFNSYIPIAPAEIERIEILKGASSAIYGSEAVGGVIHIITKTFAAKAGKAGMQLNAQATAGEFGLANGQMGGFFQKGNTAVGGGILSNNANGQPQRGIDGYFHNTTASLSINQYLNAHWNVAFRSSYDTRDFAAQNFYTTFKSDTANEKVTSYWNQLKLSFNKTNHSFSFDAGYKDVKDEYKYNSISTANLNKSKLWQALAMYNWQANEKTSITTGAQFLNKEIASNDRGDHKLKQAGYFLVVNQKIGKAFNASPAARVEYSERSGWEVVPQLNLSYKLPYAQLRASTGKTIRDADFTERFNNYNKASVASGRIGNPDLQQERSISYEAGGDYFGVKNFKISGTFFQQYYTRLIDYATTSYADMPRKDNLVPTGTYALAKNISKVNSTGVEADVQYSASFSKNQQLFVTFGMTCIDSKTTDGAPSFYISSHSNFLTNFSAQYACKCFSVSLNGFYKDRAESTAPAINTEIARDYFVMNAMLQAFVYKNKVSIYSQVDNILNRQYSDLLGAKMPNRWLMGGLKLSL